MLQKTSVQLPEMILQAFGNWPGLSQSQSIRLSLDLAHYLMTLNTEHIAAVADEFYPILCGALEDLDYNDYRIAARSLPALITGYLCEESHSWKYEHGDQHELDPGKLVAEVERMDAIGRIGVLTCVVAERHRRATATLESQKPPNGRRGGKTKRRII